MDEIPRRIAIVGNAGAGKSRLAVQVSAATNLPVFHLDRYFWSAGWVMVEAETFDARHADLIAQPVWVIDGNFSRTLATRAGAADLVILFDLPRWQCLWGVLKRIAKTYGTERPDMAPGCPERIDFGFLAYVWAWKRKRRAQTLAALEGAIDDGRVLVVRRHRDLARVWEKLNTQTPPSQPFHRARQ